LREAQQAAEAEFADALEGHAQRVAESATARERQRRLRDAEQRDAAQIRALSQRASALIREQAGLREEREAIGSSTVDVGTPLAETEEAIATLETVVRGDDEEAARLESESDTITSEQRQAQTELANQRAAESGAAADAERGRALLDHLQMELAAVCEALMSDSSALLSADVPLPAEIARLDDDALHARLQRAQRELRSVGSVDYGVLADYGALRDRYTSITEQLDDLREAEVAIREGMAEARRQIQERFSAAFESVNDRFKQSFRELFQGGDAELLLAGDPDSAQCTVDIVAQPPGKRLNRLATLSGGERALVGAALLLALIGANPSPFCMLDEVDAALDDANVQRFAAAIRSLASSTQFILVTHNRATMEMADVLYGVTMAAGAASQILAMRLPD
jgi:chromosome segregation protein